uniref:Protein PsbN n=2 Tax=Auxenochlorella protothecoides TaxID=3075 RepID=A0A1Y0JY46_AUXPR|nr:n protein of photosystem ii [Auxenochlorella protothecoides]
MSLNFIEIFRFCGYLLLIYNVLGKKIMENSAIFITIFLWCLLITITGYSIYIGFGPPSQELRDPFEEHED